MTLLYRLAEWHALAKLRMHTESTLTLFKTITTSLCHEIRNFRDVTCEAFETVELEKEAAARGRQRANANVKHGSGSGLPTPPFVDTPHPPSSSSVQPGPSAPKPHDERRKGKKLNISTYKFHALPDYIHTIRMFGTTDSYSTQTVRFCLIHH